MGISSYKGVMKTERQKLVKKLDDIVSKIVRLRDKNCIRCGSTKALTCSHFWNRNRKSTRWDLDNCDAACFPCHMFHLEKQKMGWYRDFKLKQLGTDKYELLEVRANTTTKYDVIDLEIMYRQFVEQYKLMEFE